MILSRSFLRRQQQTPATSMNNSYNKKKWFVPTVPLIEHDTNTIFAFVLKHCYENKWQCLGNTTRHISFSIRYFVSDVGSECTASKSDTSSLNAVLHECGTASPFDGDFACT